MKVPPRLDDSRDGPRAWVRGLITLLLVCCPPLHAAPSDGLTVISLNIAHGRGDSFNQLFLGADTIRAKLGLTAASAGS